MTANMEAYGELCEELKRVALLGSCASLLGWDEQTYLPPGGAEHRANQLSLLAGMRHEQATSDRIGDLLSTVEQSMDGEADDSDVAVNIREARRNYDRATKLPRRLVEELSRVTTLSQQAWVQARKANDFSQFQSWLQQVVDLKKEEAQALSNGDGPLYDALLDEYEPGASTTEIRDVFSSLRDELVPLVQAIADAATRPDIEIVERNYPVDAQETFGRMAAEKIGFDFHRGRLDVTAHPFCSGIGPGDCRLTTRYDPNHFNGAFFGTLHEAGHGMYEQGLQADAFGTPLGESVSLGIHESQSRMWENLVGRSKAFWQHFYPTATEHFPEALNGVSIDQFYGAINEVRPSFIRVEADEVTYNLHIMLRFEMEQALIGGDLSIGDVPGAWNETFEKFLGLTPPDDANGCIQDVHWSAGLIGYFPTYALGNLYASQFFRAAGEALGDLNEMFANGEFAPLKQWLNENIHQQGQRYRATKLVEVVTGSPLSPEPLLTHLKTKFGELYSL